MLNSRVWQLVGMGWFIAISLLLGIAGGLWLDSLVGLSPLFLLLGLFLGLGVGFWGLFKMLRDVTRNG